MATPLTIERPDTGELRLSGCFTLADDDDAWARVHRAIREGAIERIDVSRIEQIDGVGASQLLAIRAELAVRLQFDVKIVGANADVQKLLEIYGCPSDVQCLKAAPRRQGFLDQIGCATADILRGIREVLSYFGDLVIACARAVRRPSSINWSSVPHLMERAGADAVPIVLLINFLIGLIIGLQSANQLAKFGANIFIADLVGLSLARELGPLMTAIIVAGRSGAAYAAELGTMRVSEEIDALETLQLDPQRFLVLPRVIALACMVPALTLGGILVGILGGLVVAVTALGLPPIAYWNELTRAMRLLDFGEGLSKSAVFAIVITLIACQRGLAARGGAAGVGSSTTSAVVTTLFYLIAIDAVLATLFNAIR